MHNIAGVIHNTGACAAGAKVQSQVHLSSRVRLGFEACQINASLRCPAGFAVLCYYVGENATANVKLCCQTHKARLSDSCQVIQNTVGHIFMEVTIVAERPHIEL